jgi:Lamin Tail Domain/PEP-CTERM motif
MCKEIAVEMRAFFKFTPKEALMNTSRGMSVAVLIVLAAIAAPCRGALVITEAMSSSGSGGTADWFELTNTGAAPLTITGDKMDDSSNTFGLSVDLLGVAMIAPGESAVFIESTAPATDIAAFRTFWGGAGALAGVQIGSYSGSGVSLSSNTDGVVIFDSVGNTIAGPVSFGAATSGVSFGYNPTTQTFGDLSQAGQFGAFTSADPLGNVGSPGAVPEPSTVVIAGLGALGLLGWRLRTRRSGRVVRR